MLQQAVDFTDAERGPDPVRPKKNVSELTAQTLLGNSTLIASGTSKAGSLVGPSLSGQTTLTEFAEMREEAYPLGSRRPY